MQIIRCVVAVGAFTVAAMALRRGMLLWHRDKRFPKDLVTGVVFFSRAFHHGGERAQLPFAAGSFLVGVVLLIAPAHGRGQARVGGMRWWLDGTVVVGITVSVGLMLAIIYFNRPRLLVPPFMRTELGITTAWWRSRHRKNRQ